MATGPLLALGWELAQLVGVVPGTFDPADIVAYALALQTALLIHRAGASARNPSDVVVGGPVGEELGR